MPAYLKPMEWLSVVRTEYLESFIRSGGSAVKFVVPMDEMEAVDIKSGLQKRASETGFHYASIDASTTKIHLIERLFYDIARQVDWDNFAYKFLRHSLEGHYKLPDTREHFNLKTLAALNEYEEPEIRMAVNGILRRELFKDYAMTQEFRRAMIKLCEAQLVPAEVTADICGAVKAWLRGELRLISALKPALIFQKIGRHNARHLIFSLSHWLRISGGGGLVLMLDISRYLQERPKEPDGTYYYSTPQVLDCYEVLRQFIDGTDESESLFIAVLAPIKFLDEGDKRRGVCAYDALKLRIWDEVQDRKFANPLSPLIRLSACLRAETGKEVSL